MRARPSIRMVVPTLVVFLCCVTTVAASAASQYGARPTSGVALHSMARSSAKYLGSARYADAVGDHAVLRLWTGPVVKASALPAAVLANCNPSYNGDPTRSLYQKITGTVEIVSSLPADVSFYIDQMHMVDGSLWNPDTSGASTVIMDSRTGFSCDAPAGLSWTDLAAKKPVPFTAWLIFADIISPKYPHGNPRNLRDQSWRIPSMIGLGTGASSLGKISGPDFVACASSTPYQAIFYFTPSGHPPSGARC